MLRRFTYDHPVYTAAGVAAQARHAEVSGVRRTHYCGAYWGWGFHEDGVVSGLRVCEELAARRRDRGRWPRGSRRHRARRRLDEEALAA